jgi:hypothetical protein
VVSERKWRDMCRGVVRIGGGYMYIVCVVLRDLLTSGYFFFFFFFSQRRDRVRGVYVAKDKIM